MNFNGVNAEYIGGKLHRVSVSWTTPDHGATVDAAELWATEALRIEPGESAKILETSQRALAEARGELAELHDEESGVLAERKAAVMAGNALAPIEKKLVSTQGRIGILQGRVGHLAQICTELERTAKKEHADAARKKLATLEAEINDAVKQATANLAIHADVLTAVLEARAKADALARQAQKILRSV